MVNEYDLENFHEDLIYVIECYSIRIGGEAKTELSNMGKQLEQSGLSSAGQLATELSRIRTDFLFDREGGIHRLTSLRRKIRNTLQRQHDKELIYVYEGILE